MMSSQNPLPIRTFLDSFVVTKLILLKKITITAICRTQGITQTVYAVSKTPVCMCNVCPTCTCVNMKPVGHCKSVLINAGLRSGGEEGRSQIRRNN